MSTKKVVHLQPQKSVLTTAAGLRNHLFEQLEELRAGKISPSKARSHASVAREIIGTVRTEMQFAELTRQTVSKESSEFFLDAQS